MARPILACFYKIQGLSFLRRCLAILAHLCKITFNISVTYLESSQLSKMGFFAKIVKDFQAINIFAKSSVLDV